MVISLLTMERTLLFLFKVFINDSFSKLHLCKYYKVCIYKLDSHFWLRLYTGYAVFILCTFFTSCPDKIFRTRI